MKKYAEITRIPFLSSEQPNEKSYAGIGSRALNEPSKTLTDEYKEDIKMMMIKSGYYLSLIGFTLNSGGAEGPDEWFELGADLAKQYHNKGSKVIILPWQAFRENPSHYHLGSMNKELLIESMDWASENHPRWKAEKTSKENYQYPSLRNLEVYQKMMTRNVPQVKGFDLKQNVNFVLCWTPDGCINHIERTSKTGGTGQAIAIASKIGIKVYNLKREEHYLRIKKAISEWENKFGLMPDPLTLPQKKDLKNNKMKP